MDEGFFGILLLVAVSIIAAAAFHAKGRSFLLANFASALTAIGTVLVVDTIRLGHPDKFLPIAFVVGGIYAFLISLPVGLITRWISNRRRQEER
ncbi:hypothetical protein ACXR0O_10250 [Verrucomicrobiota bacterium sgz303538]